ncbi:hypothetical protein ABVT39_003399 [Epinephelus coioides]
MVFLVRLKYIFDSCWINTSDVYSFIALPNKRDFELIFLQEAPMRRFLDVYSTKQGEPKWREWMVESAIQIDIVNLVVKFWTGRVPDNNVELYLSRFCDILQVNKPLDKHGIWYGVRKYKVKLHKDTGGQVKQIPNCISMGPYNGRIIYPGQTTCCFICGSPDHQVKQCPTEKYWKCGGLGHKATTCNSESLCNLCGQNVHIFFNCPHSYANQARAHHQPGPTLQQQPGPTLQQQPGCVSQQQPGPAQLQCGSGDQQQPEPCDQQLRQTCPSDQQQHQQPTFQQPLHLSPAKCQQQRMQLGPGENPSAEHQHRRQLIPAPEPVNHLRHHSLPPALQQKPYTKPETQRRPHSQPSAREQQQQQQQQRRSDPGGQLQQHSALQSAATLYLLLCQLKGNS